MLTGIVGWISFWIPYWLFSFVIPYDKKSLDIIPSEPVVKVVVRNMLLSLPFSILLWNLSPDLVLIIKSYSEGLGDSLYNSMVIRFIVSIIMMDGWFYLIHRLLHHKLFYPLHKQHHQFTTPYPIVAVYSSPFEALFCDVMAMGLGPCLLKMQGIEMCVWMCCAAIHSLLLHSSLSHGRDHNIHHGKILYNFGLISIFDHIFGTYK